TTIDPFQDRSRPDRARARTGRGRLRFLGKQYRVRRVAVAGSAPISGGQQDSRYHLQVPVLQLSRSPAARLTGASRLCLCDRPQYNSQYHLAWDWAGSYWYALTRELGIRGQCHCLFLRSNKSASTAGSGWLYGGKQRDARAPIRIQDDSG